VRTRIATKTLWELWTAIPIHAQHSVEEQEEEDQRIPAPGAAEKSSRRRLCRGTPRSRGSLGGEPSGACERWRRPGSAESGSATPCRRAGRYSGPVGNEARAPRGRSASGASPVRATQGWPGTEGVSPAAKREATSVRSSHVVVSWTGRSRRLYGAGRRSNRCRRPSGPARPLSELKRRQAVALDAL
jgi:hypothetical protein